MMLVNRRRGVRWLQGGKVLAMPPVVGVLALATVGALGGDVSDRPVEPLQVLERFVGEWETAATLRRPGPPPSEIVTRGTATCQRTLGGQWFEFRTETIPPGESDLQVMTYDADAGVYRQWVFSSDGYRHEATGQWNRATNTLRWTGRSGDGTFVIDDHWASPDRLEWTLRRTNPQGALVQTSDGTVKRAEAR